MASWDYLNVAKEMLVEFMQLMEEMIWIPLSVEPARVHAEMVNTRDFMEKKGPY